MTNGGAVMSVKTIDCAVLANGGTLRDIGDTLLGASTSFDPTSSLSEPGGRVPLTCCWPA